MVNRRPGRPSLQPIRTRSRARRSWDPQKHDGPANVPGVLVTCGRYRILDATERQDVPGELVLGGPGLPVTGARRPPTSRPVFVGCPTHGEHEIDPEALWREVQRAVNGQIVTGRRRVNFRRVEAARSFEKKTYNSE